MALTLSAAETQVRDLTRHDVDTRLSQAQAWRWLNHEYAQLRTWLQDVAPEFYNVVSGSIALAEGDEIQLTSALVTFERLRRVEYDAGSENWRPMELGSPVDPNRHGSRGPTFRVEGNRLRFGPDNRFSGDVRVVYWVTPPALAAGGSAFEIPVQLEHPLILRACGWVGVRDSKDQARSKKEFRDDADELLKEVVPLLGRQNGQHAANAGLRRVWRGP